ncbi:hypothetical protein BD410DRAFT_781527 [Rickenella mellea]|uniref:Uncharacterized protein n=1 Tax=Rickenella mellea TaxID=50990 RepID=A0A4Y7QNT6_9AGAM|nr:hypothetical protein BD410DRAFT_781527 [Rickenella mellea]
MATQHRQPPSRLYIPPSMGGQQPDGAQMFSPALHTGMQQSFMPSFPLNTPSAMQTPMQSSFYPHPPGAPARPAHVGHGRFSSMAQLAAAGIHPPNMPITPINQHQFPPHMMLGGQPGLSAQPFVPKSRRTPSLGGPPKAPLGGPGRKHSPLPPAASIAAAAVADKLKQKKIVIKIPAESSSADDAETSTPTPRALWSRTPLHPSLLPETPAILPPEKISSEGHPDEDSKRPLPPTIDVFLPGKAAWDDMKQRIIEEKLKKLGVEKGLGSSVPGIIAPHARAASISSPADPALLFYKLNKLQQSQNASHTSSLAPSPQPSSLSVSPNPSMPPRFQNSHGHSMSLAQPNFAVPSYNPNGAINIYGPQSAVGPDITFSNLQDQPPSLDLFAPQGRVPVPVASLNPPAVPSRPESKPDFARGFGLDIPEEEEEEEQEDIAQPSEPNFEEPAEESTALVLQDDLRAEIEPVEDTSAMKTAVHTRHASRVSVALSVGSVKKPLEEVANVYEGDSGATQVDGGDEEEKVSPQDPELDTDGVGEWTGSEDFRSPGDASEEESIGEWSNPSDEERARQDRARRRARRRALELPRRLPNFPRPPDAPFVGRRPDDDIISNPSEEEHMLQAAPHNVQDHDGRAHLRTPSTSSGRITRPLPPLPHSRNDSGQFSYHDPALAHSRGTSDQFVYPTSRPSSNPNMPDTAVPIKKEALNPFAKPFVFGSRPSISFQPGSFGGSAGSSQHAPSPAGHNRMPSLGSSILNVAAPEFKPGSFNFRPPAGVPELTFPTPIVAPPVAPDLTTRAAQGREKRMKLTDSLNGESQSEDEENTNPFNTFRFPQESVSPQPKRRSAPASPKQSTTRRKDSLNAQAPPFTFSGFSSLAPLTLPFAPSDNKLPHPLVSSERDDDSNISRSEDGDDEDDDQDSQAGLHLPSVSKQKRAPIPLDFKHPVSTNMVPAGLFKNLGSADLTDDRDRTRPTVRSRLDTRDTYDHKREPSLDDSSVPAISNHASRRLTLDSEAVDTPVEFNESLGSANQMGRRSSLPTLHNASDSKTSIRIPDLGSADHANRFEQRLENMIDSKIDKLRKTMLAVQAPPDAKFISVATDEMVKEAMTMFRTQLQESAARGFDDSQADARGEMDFELIRNIIDQSHEDSRKLLQRELSEILQRFDSAALHGSTGVSPNLVPMIQDLRTTILRSDAHITDRLEGLEESSRIHMGDNERSSLVYELLDALTPNLAALRPEPLDYDSLTARLTQAVKPHISQLIDLASDKRETAGLIVDSLRPHLRNLIPQAPGLDVDNIVRQVTANVSRIVDPIDTHVIKEQVADLVVERMDSRLAVRDMALNADKLAERMGEIVAPLISRVDQLVESVDSVGNDQDDISSLTQGLAAAHKDLTAALSDLPAQLIAATETLQLAHKQSTVHESEQRKQHERLAKIEGSVDSVVTSRETLLAQNERLLTLSQDIAARISAIPDSLKETTQLMQTTQSDILDRLSSRKESEELRTVTLANTDLQVQLAKARAAHGQVRVEKDNLNERFVVVEAERDLLRTQIEELQSTATTRASEHAALQSRATEQELAMQTALERLKTSDVTAQAQQERIAELEKANRELMLEKHQWKSKVEALEMQVAFGLRDKEAVVQTLNLVQSDRDSLAAQQSHWDDLRRAGENIEALAKLIGQADSEEVKELKRARDRSKVLEGEHAALQKRFKDQESRLANVERASATARQNLASAQQRASDWEKKARDFEADLERTSTKLEQSEQTRSQLDADYSMTRLQLEEHEAEDRVVKDRERNLLEEKSALESRIAKLTADLEHAKRSGYTNGHDSTLRSSSRASPAYGATPRLTNGKPLSRPVSIAPSSPPSSTWDSMHAPSGGRTTPKPWQSSGYNRARAPSPTPSTVSVTPTEGADGWWS